MSRLASLSCLVSCRPNLDLLINSFISVIGTLKGYDQLMNLVMDEVQEYLRDPESGELTDKTRPLGLAVLRGTALTVINPADGFEQIEK